MPRRAQPLPPDAKRIPRVFDLRFRGLDLVPRRGRERDRFRIQTLAQSVEQYNERLTFVQTLHDNAQDDVLRGLNDGLFTIRELEQAYRRGARDVALLLGRRRTAEDEAKADADALRRNPPLKPLVEAYKAQWHGSDRERMEEVLDRFMAVLGEQARVSHVTTAAVKSYLGTLTVVRQNWKKRKAGTPLAPSTINRHRTVIQGLCSSLKADGVLAVHPFEDGKIPALDAGQSVPQELSPTDVRDYLACVQATRPVVLLPLYLMMHTGIDKGELQALRALDVIDTATGMWLRTTRPKTGRRTRAATRRVPVTIPDLMDGLRDHITLYGLSGEDVLFPAATDWQLEQAHKAAVTKIKRASVTMKGLRHVAAIYWRKAGTDIQTIQKWLGHANITSTTIYTEFGQDTDWETPLAVKAGDLMRSAIPVFVPTPESPDTTLEGKP